MPSIISATAGDEVIPGDWIPTAFIKPLVFVFSIIKSPVDEAGLRPVKDLINSFKFITSSLTDFWASL